MSDCCDCEYFATKRENKEIYVCSKYNKQGNRNDDYPFFSKMKECVKNDLEQAEHYLTEIYDFFDLNTIADITNVKNKINEKIKEINKELMEDDGRD